MIEIYTDGSCKPTNPGPAGYGVVFIEDGEVVHYCSAFIGKETNNVAEIGGIEYAIDHLIETGRSWSKAVIYTDSNYCVGLFTKNWNAKKNKELVKRVRDGVAQLVRRQIANLKIAGSNPAAVFIF